jgi:hypothetical protein
MDSKAVNPLAKHFRQAAIYFKLPSKGQFYPEGALEMPSNEELAVYPMTTKDEITIRTPDSLINGSCIVDVIQSCVPSMKDVWGVPSIDVDAALIAIRIASYGHEMEIKVKCPHCDHENEFVVDLRTILDDMQIPNFNDIIKIEGLKYKLKPQNYQTTNRINMLRFEEQKMVSQLLNSADEEDQSKRLEIFRKKMQDLVELNLDVLAECTEYIQLDDNTVVSDKTHIREYYSQCDKKITKNLSDIFREKNEAVINNLVKANCNNCSKLFSSSLEFDYSNFFGKGF